jgi:tetratricopeptide (TPR) repeat protein
MKTVVIYLVTSISAAAVLALSSGAFSQESPAVTPGIRDLTQTEAQRSVELVFRGRSRGALAYLDSLKGPCDDQPLYLIMRARALQELIPMDDLGNDYARAMSEPALEHLDRAIAACTARIERDDSDPQMYLYRGWAWMAKSYIRSMTRSFWTAGREAKRGKKDLEVYLRTRPDDPTAAGIMGAFLYFADTIPGAFKFLSKLLFLPTGDREKGLEHLDRAVRTEGLMQNDYKLVLYNVLFFFEGRYEDGLMGMREMRSRYPEYTRNAIPLAVSKMIDPKLTGEYDRQVEQTIQSVYGGPHREVDWNSLYVVQMFRAYTDRYCNHPRVAMARLRSIIHESPAHPDWVKVFARFELGRILASLGQKEAATEMFGSIIAADRPGHYKDYAEEMMSDLEKYQHLFDNPPARPDDAWIVRLYSARGDSLSVLRQRFESLDPASIVASFYAGESCLLMGDMESALDAYGRVLDADAPGWDETYQFFNDTATTEIYTARGDYKTAAQFQERALKYYRKEYLLDWVLEGRQRYFSRLSEGKESRPPTLLSVKP